MIPDTPTRHHALTIVLHWLTVGFLIIGIAAVLTRGLIDDRAAKLVLLNIHRTCGLLVMVICTMRLATRWPLAAGTVNNALPKLVRLASKIGHSLLYLGLIAIPALGWGLSNARGQAVNFFWVIPMPSLLSRDRELAEQLESWHENLAWALIVLASIHAIAALWHHYARKDHVLRSMLPKSLVP